MEIVTKILTLIPVILAAISAGASYVVAFKAKRKAKAEAAAAATEAAKAQAEAEQAAAELAMEKAAKEFIIEAETLYKAYDDILKARGASAGPMKKETVLAKLRTYAIEQGIAIDVEAWSAKIDTLVKFTKSVNVKTN